MVAVRGTVRLNQLIRSAIEFSSQSFIYITKPFYNCVLIFQFSSWSRKGKEHFIVDDLIFWQ